MKANNKKNVFARFVTMALTGAMLAGTGLPSIIAGAAGYDLNGMSGPNNLAYNGKFYSDYNSIEEVFEAANKLNAEVVAEGAVMMKNDGTLPLDPRFNAISVLGVRSGDLREGVDGTVVQPNAPIGMAEGLRNAGFKVNPVLENWYKNLGTKLEMEETTDFSEAVERSIKNYNDAAVIVIQRCDFKENVDGSVALTGITANNGKDVNDMVNGPFAGNRENDSLRELQDEVKEGTKETDPYGWEHAHSAQTPAKEGETANEHGNVEVKHELQLTSSEIELIDYAKANFDKVMVLFNSSHTFEMYNLENDPEINALLWFGRPGIHDGGVTAVAKILSGEITPSGAHSAQYVRDFTADPTWFNSVTGRQFRYGAYSEEVPGDFVYRYPDENGKYLTIAPGNTGIGGIRAVEYEEGIYLGYKYYETYWNEIAQGNTSLTKDADPSEYQAIADAWHDFNVVYPFGYGLSYTTFKFDMGGVYTDAACTNELTGTIDGSIFGSAVNAPAKVKKVYVPVTVENTGDVEGKKAVQVYVTAPYEENGIEKSFVKLVGFAKTKNLKPGAKQTVTVEIDMQDVASFDYDDANGNGNKGWELDEGKYTFRAMDNSSVLRSQRAGVYDEADFTIGGEIAINMKLDNFSDNEAKALLSDPNEMDYSIRQGGGVFSVAEDAGMTILSRSDMEGTFPEPPTVADLTITQAAIDRQKQVLGMNTSNNFKGFYGEEYGSIDNAEQPWYVEAIPENWTQQDPATVNEDRVGGKTKVQLYQMAGVPLDGSIKVEGDDEFTWDDFMNQLTYAEMKGLWGSAPGAIAAIGKQKDSNADRPLNLGGTFTWADAPLQAATWNVELINKVGQMVGEFGLQKGVGGTSGWWGPGANINRSQFAGRTKEYYSQDGILNGYISAASVSGAQSKGINVYIKHCALYDSEDMNAGTTVWVDEQTMRENYLVAFKKTMQDGNCAGAMISCWRIGQEQICNNYDFITGIFIKEYGWFGEWVTDHTGGQNSPNWTNPAAPAGETKYNWTSGNLNSQEVALRNGGLTIMGSGSGALKGVWDQTLRNGKGGVNVTYGSGETAKTMESVGEYYYMRMMALKGLYKAANSKLVTNGVDTGAMKAATLEFKQATAGNQKVGLTEEALNGSEALYSITGTLPAGLSFNAVTGVISGSPALPGTNVVTVNANIDGWIKLSAKYTINVASAFTADLPEAEIGEEYEASVTGAFTGNVTYSVASGNLPAGLTMANDGTITGTPTAAGEYTFTVNARIATGSGTQVSYTNYGSEEFTITVPAGEVEVEPAFQVRVENGMIQITNDAGANWIDVIAVSELKGEAGEAGEDAVAPTVEISEDGYWVINGEKTEVKAVGQDGADGKDGAPGKDGVNGKDGKDGQDALAALGCTSSISVGVVALVALAGVAVALRKREE